MARRKRSLLQRIHDYFLPHKRNGYKPHVFRVASVAAILLAVVILEGAYLTQIHFVFPRTNFLASVLPGTLIALTNTDRAANDAPAVTENPTLDQAATLAAQDMASKGYFAHISPSGVTPWDWLDQVGYSYSYAGENLAVNFDDSASVESAWMASPTHHANIVKPQYTQMGVGVANGLYQGQQTTFVVTFFATPADAAAPAEPPAVAAATPAPVAIATPTPSGGSTSTIPITPAVLGTNVSPPVAVVVPTPAPAAPTLLAKAATSPTNTIVIILSILAGIVLVLFVAAVAVKARVQYIEVVGGGLALIVVLIGLIIFNTASVGKVEVPTNSQGSSVVG